MPMAFSEGFFFLITKNASFKKVFICFCTQNVMITMDTCRHCSDSCTKQEKSVTSVIDLFFLSKERGWFGSEFKLGNKV